MHSAGLELTKLTYTRLEDNLIRHRGDRLYTSLGLFFCHTTTLQLLDKPWSQVSSLFPLCSRLQFLSLIGFSNRTARRFFIECC